MSINVMFVSFSASTEVDMARGSCDHPDFGAVVCTSSSPLL